MAYVIFYNAKRKLRTMKKRSDIVERRQNVIIECIQRRGIVTPMEIAEYVCGHMREYRNRTPRIVYSNIFQDLRQIGAVKIFGYVLPTTNVKVTVERGKHNGKR